MAISGRVIRGRIKSVKNTKKITKAMELVSAAKMRRAVAAALQSRTYARYAWELLTRLEATGRALEKSEHPLLAVRPVKKILVVAITSNRGLAGAFNSNVIKLVAQQIRHPEQIARNRVGKRWIEPANDHPEMEFVIVGKRGETALRRITDKIVASFVDVPDVPKLSDVTALITLAIGGYERGEYDKVVLAYTDFVSALVQKPKVRQLLPISTVDIEKTLFPEGVVADPVGHEEWSEVFVEFEPSITEIIGAAVTRLIESQVYQAVLESSASEHSARMMSMRQATDAATDMIDTLTLVFNQARQASITKEISEISAGKAALE